MSINDVMGFLTVSIGNGNKLSFVGDKIHTGNDCFISANSIDPDLDYLIFFDSRGISKGFDDSLVKGVLERLVGKKYIAICRPLNLTTWATLYNFLSINNINPKVIITNMGFVDFISKKKKLIDEAIRQIEFRFGSSVAHTVFEQNYLLNSGIAEELYSMVYSPKYLQFVQEIAERSNLIVLNTPTVKDNISIPRDRPTCFFSGIEQSNQFNRKIKGATILEFGMFDVEQTYDAVHYTVAGNKLIMNQLETYL